MHLKNVLFALPLVKKRLDSHTQELVEGASVAILLKVLGAGLAFGFNVMLARMLGADGAGIYFLALTAATIASVVGRLGLDNALLRFVAASASEGDWRSAGGVYKKGMRLALVASFLSALILFILAPRLAGSVFSKPELRTPLRLIALAILPMSISILHAELLKAIKRVRDSIIVQSVAIPAFCLVGVVFLGRAYGVRGAIWAFNLAVAATALSGFWLWSVGRHRVNGRAGDFSTGKLLGSSMPLFWGSLLSLGMMWATTFFLGVWGTTRDVGIFGAAYRVAGLTSFILVAVNTAAAPQFAAFYQRDDMVSLRSTARNAAKLMTVLAAPILALFIIIPSSIMGIFGPQFSDGAAALTILALGQFVNVVTGSVGYLLMMTGHERLMRNAVFAAATINVVLSVILIPPFGVLGAAIASALSLAAQNVVAYYFAVTAIGISTLPLPGDLSGENSPRKK